MSPIELNVKNQQPILPGKQQTTNGRQNYKENRKKNPEEKTKLCQSQGIMRRKKAWVS